MTAATTTPSRPPRIRNGTYLGARRTVTARRSGATGESSGAMLLSLLPPRTRIFAAFRGDFGPPRRGSPWRRSDFVAEIRKPSGNADGGADYGMGEGAVRILVRTPHGKHSG